MSKRKERPAHRPPIPPGDRLDVRLSICPTASDYGPLVKLAKRKKLRLGTLVSQMVQDYLITRDGRPLPVDRFPRAHSISIRLTDRHHKILLDAAEKLGIKPGTYVTRILQFCLQKQ